MYGSADDSFGYAVSCSVDRMLVGAHGAAAGNGAAYLFERNVGGSNKWGEVTILTASDGASGDWFGSAVSISGDRAAVGASRNDDDGNDSGSVYIFDRNAGGLNNWGQVAKIVASDASSNDWFGASLVWAVWWGFPGANPCPK